LEYKNEQECIASINNLDSNSITLHFESEDKAKGIQQVLCLTYLWCIEMRWDGLLSTFHLLSVAIIVNKTILALGPLLFAEREIGTMEIHHSLC
jgi:hypothetical protein